MVIKALDFRFMLFEYYKQLRINEVDLAVILFIEHLQKKETDFITPDLISLQSNLKIEQIDESMVRLVSKGLLEFTTKNGKMITSLNPLRNKLQQLFMIDYEENKETNTSEFNNQSEEIYNIIQTGFGRSLSPLEMQTINDWISYGYTINMIKEAYESATKNRKFNIRAIDKALLKLATSVDYQNEGASAQDDIYRKDINKTLEDVNDSLKNEKK